MIDGPLEEFESSAAAAAADALSADQRGDGPMSVAGESPAAEVDEAPDAEADEAPAAETDETPAADGSPAGPRTVGRYIADVLRAAGVRYAFTVPGESFLGLLDHLGEAGIRVVATRHEGAAAFMAEAHGQLTGRPAACLATRAVGAANLAIGIHTATADSTPMFALIGQVDRPSRGREAFQEADLVGTIGGLATWAVEIDDAAVAGQAMAEAVGHALGERPGPVLLSLPEDLLDELMPVNGWSAPPRAVPRRATEAEIRSVLQLLASAERPVILAGAGVLRARTSNDLIRLAELLHVPIVASWRHGDVVSNDHPLYLGMAGLAAPATVRARLETADAMLVIGCRLNEPTSFGWTVPAASTRWAHVDLAPVRPSPDLRPADIVVTTDARSFVRSAVARLETKGVLDAALVARRDGHNGPDRAAWEAASVVDASPWSGPGVHPGRTIATLRRVLPDDAIVTTDAGSFGGWAARGFRFRRPGTFLGPTSGAMGYGFPAAIAAALVHRDRPVVALVGDGGMGMTLGEIETAVREGARVIALVFDNEQYGMIRGYQDRRDGGRPVGTDLGPIDFAAIARACGARGVRVDTDDAFEPALRQAMAEERPTLIQLSLDRRWLSVDRPAVE